MKLKNILYSLILIFQITFQIEAQNTNPEVTNVAFSIAGTTVTVTYNVTDAVQTSVTIIMLVSSNNGSTWDFNYGSATGDIGTNVSVGSNKAIQWTYNGVYNPDFKIRIYANDKTADGSPCPGVATVDYGGKIYNTIQIGTQCWLKENLDIGTRINGSQNQTNNSPTNFIEKYCYNDLDANCVTYGGLYEWAEAVQYKNGATNSSSPSPTFTGNIQGVCPTGWHIPTSAEYQGLKTTVSNNGNSLKAIGQGSGGGTGTNTSGFSALLAGFNNYSFYSIGSDTHLWTSTEYLASYSVDIRMDYTTSDIAFDNFEKSYGYSVRCLKD